MRKILISAAAAATALTIAAPAAAQYYPAPQNYGYGYNNHYGQVRHLQYRVDQLRRHIDRLDARNRISDREADRLRRQANELRRDLHRASRYGLHPNQRYRIEQRIARLEWRVQRDMRDGNRWGYGYGNGWNDRDRDDRDDRQDRRWDRDDDDDDDD